MRHRTFIEYEDYTPDCPENRLLHSALWACVKHSKDKNNKKLANQHCHMFETIGKSKHYKKDFTHWKLNRMYPAYDEIRGITELILYGIQPFMSQGSHKAPAILFPMEIVYEKYIANCLQKYPQDYNVDPQNTNEHLTKSKAFNLRPDILLTADDESNIVLDTKWKKYENIGSIDSNDAYQMFAYSQAHNADTILLYPRDHREHTDDYLKENNNQSETFKHGYKEHSEKYKENSKKLKTHITDLSQEPKDIAKAIINAIPKNPKV